MTIVRLPDTFCAVTSSTHGGGILMDLSAAKRGSEKRRGEEKKKAKEREEEKRTKKRT